MARQDTYPTIAPRAGVKSTVVDPTDTAQSPQGSTKTVDYEDIAAVTYTTIDCTGSSTDIDLSAFSRYTIQGYTSGHVFTFSNFPTKAPVQFLCFKSGDGVDATISLPGAANLSFKDNTEIVLRQGAENNILANWVGGGVGELQALWSARPTRDQLKARIDGGEVPISGEEYETSDGLKYIGSLGATHIPDMHGVIPKPIGELLATFSIVQFGAEEGTGTPNQTPKIQAALDYVITLPKGGQVFVPDGQWLCNTTLNLLRGTKEVHARLIGESQSSVLDFRRMAVLEDPRNPVDPANPVYTKCLEYDGTGTDGPTYIDIDNISIRGNAAKEMVGLSVDFLSQSIFTGIKFENLFQAIRTENSFTFTVENCFFIGISMSLLTFKGSANWHALKFTGNKVYNVAMEGGYLFHDTSDDGNRTHTISISQNNFDLCGAWVKTEPGSGGIVGLIWTENYSEGFTSLPYFDIDATAPIYGLFITGGSVSTGAVTGTPPVQVWDNIRGGHIQGVRINGITIEQGNNCTFFDWDTKSCDIIGGAPPLPDGKVRSRANGSAVANSTFELNAPWVPRPGWEGLSYQSTNSNDRIYLQGAVDYATAIAAATPITVFNLPSGMRPEGPLFFRSYDNVGNEIDITIGTNGNVIAETQVSGVRYVHFDLNFRPASQ